MANTSEEEENRGPWTIEKFNDLQGYIGCSIKFNYTHVKTGAIEEYKGTLINFEVMKLVLKRIDDSKGTSKGNYSVYKLTTNNRNNMFYVDLPKGTHILQPEQEYPRLLEGTREGPIIVDCSVRQKSTPIEQPKKSFFRFFGGKKRLSTRKTTNRRRKQRKVRRTHRARRS